MSKPIASLSLDLDNQWSYMKTHGDAGWDTFPSYLDVVVPRVLDMLKSRGLTITVFVVGQDAALPKNRDALSAIAPAGHEIGNHSFNHEPWLHLYSRDEIEDDLARAEEHIEGATGQRPVGFRGPGFSLSGTVLEVLKSRGYLYDCSTLPTFIGPLARVYYFMTSGLSRRERERRSALFGTLREGLRPLTPYHWRTTKGELLEIPVTTMPIFRAPFHASYILYLSTFSRTAALNYLRIALKLCSSTGIHPSFLLHPLDFLGADDDAELSFFPAMRIPTSKKLEFMKTVLDLLTQRFRVVTMHEHARQAAAGKSLPVHHPSFAVLR